PGPRPRPWHVRRGRSPASLQHLRLEVHGALAQHHPRRGRSSGPEWRAAQSARIYRVMSLPRKVRLSGIMSVVIALVVAFVWWVFIVPQYKDYKERKQRKEKLATIRPPAGARLTHIENFPQVAVASYSSETDCSSIEAYYQEEFPKHGFVYS